MNFSWSVYEGQKPYSVALGSSESYSKEACKGSHESLSRHSRYHHGRERREGAHSRRDAGRVCPLRVVVESEQAPRQGESQVVERPLQIRRLGDGVNIGAAQLAGHAGLEGRAVQGRRISCILTSDLVPLRAGEGVAAEAGALRGRGRHEKTADPRGEDEDEGEGECAHFEARTGSWAGSPLTLVATRRTASESTGSDAT